MVNFVVPAYPICLDKKADKWTFVVSW